MPKHPPTFKANDRLSDWPDCTVEAGCPRCGKRTVVPVSLLRQRLGDRLVIAVAQRMRCDQCGVHAAPVFLCEGFHRQGGQGGPPPGWALELIPATWGHRTIC